MGFGDFAHDVGEAGVALWGTELEGIKQGREADGADGDGALASRRVARVEPVEFDEEALSGAAKVIADHVDTHLVGHADLRL